LDVIKLTAQFVARNGKSFLTGLTSREHLNPQVRLCGCGVACVIAPDACASVRPQFNFLKPTHSMFTFFTALADSYSKVLMPPKSLSKRLQSDALDRPVVLDRCLKRLEWERTQERCGLTAVPPVALPCAHSRRFPIRSARKDAEDKAEAERDAIQAGCAQGVGAAGAEQGAVAGEGDLA
jgi:hypothetical protein